jgi:HlyD family secretion protein
MRKRPTLSTLGCLIFLSACSKNGKAPDATEDAESATPVQVAVAQRATIHEIVAAQSVLFPVRQGNIVPKISAPIQRFLVQRGDHVREGQVVAMLENRDLASAAEESKGLYQQARASYQTTTGATIPEDTVKAETDLETAKQSYEAAKKVYESRLALLNEGALARKLVDDAKVSMVQAQSLYETTQQHFKLLQSISRTEQLKGAQAQLDAAKAHYESAAAQASYAEVRSPLTGIVSDRPLNVGEMATSGSALLSIVDISRIVARSNLSVAQAADVRVGQSATISGPGGDVNGKVTVVSPAVDPSTTTVQVWVEAANPGERLKPGMTAQISIQIDALSNALVVPKSALLSLAEGGDKIMVAGTDSLAHERPVKVGVREGDNIQLLSGIKEGEQVITVGGLGLDDKAKITITKEGKDQDAGEKDEGQPFKEEKSQK